MGLVVVLQDLFYVEVEFDEFGGIYYPLVLWNNEWWCRYCDFFWDVKGKFAWVVTGFWVLWTLSSSTLSELGFKYMWSSMFLHWLYFIVYIFCFLVCKNPILGQCSSCVILQLPLILMNLPRSYSRFSIWKVIVCIWYTTWHVNVVYEIHSKYKHVYYAK